MAFVVVHVCYSEDNTPAGFRVRRSVSGATIRVLRGSFAAIGRAEQNERPERLPFAGMD